MNKDDVLAKLKEDINIFKILDKELYKDKNICYYALTQNTKLVKYVDESLLDDSDFAFSILQLSSSHFNKLSERLQNDYDFILKLSENKINVLKHIGPVIRQDAKIMINYVKMLGITKALSYAAEELKNNKEFVLYIAQNTKKADFIGDKLKQDDDFMKELIKIDLNYIKHASNNIKNDKSFLMFLENFHHAEHLGEQILNDLEFCEWLLDLDAKNLQYISENMQNNLELFKKILPKRYSLIKYANDNIKNSLELAMYCVDINSFRTLALFNDSVYLNKDLWKYALSKTTWALSSMPKEFKNDKQMWIFAWEEYVKRVQNHSMDNYDIVCESYLDFIDQAPDELIGGLKKEKVSTRKLDKQLLVKDLLSNNTYKLSDKQLKDYDVLVELLTKDREAIKDLSDEIKSSEEMFRALITCRYFGGFYEVPEEAFKNHLQIIYDELCKSPHLFKYLPDEIATEAVFCKAWYEYSKTTPKNERKYSVLDEIDLSHLDSDNIDKYAEYYKDFKIPDAFFDSEIREIDSPLNEYPEELQKMLKEEIRKSMKFSKDSKGISISSDFDSKNVEKVIKEYEMKQNQSSDIKAKKKSKWKKYLLIYLAICLVGYIVEQMLS
ncbi:hypothetical protein AVBRAN12640_06275 [Campylobacter sp. RM12640]|uniref:hypothetical protein n=3 Tax=Campylobacter TaxID=194 RepID=UPI001D355756|nr:hypothetical protein [Campylobacter sp. RM12640]MBZ7983625.1 hypothetical protein [Campylobacter sp. RM12647]MBZ7989764.1 hypothetical protein [Campylobacter sp. RM12635]